MLEKINPTKNVNKKIETLSIDQSTNKLNKMLTVETSESTTQISNEAKSLSNKKSNLHAHSKTNNELDLMDKWHPAKEHFESIRNTYDFNQESAEAHTFGYGIKIF